MITGWEYDGFIYLWELQDKLQRVVAVLFLSMSNLISISLFISNKSACIDDKQLEL